MQAIKKFQSLCTFLTMLICVVLLLCNSYQCNQQLFLYLYILLILFFSFFYRLIDFVILFLAERWRMHFSIRALWSKQGQQQTKKRAFPFLRMFKAVEALIFFYNFFTLKFWHSKRHLPQKADDVAVCKCFFFPFCFCLYYLCI